MEAPIPQPTYSDVHVQAALTQISVAYIQDEAHFIADRVFPIVPVVHQADKYYVFSKDDFLRDEAQLRADATESAGGGWTLTTQAYSAQVWAWHKDIGEQTRRNADPAIDIDVVTTKKVMQTLLIRRDRFFMTTYMTTSVWGTDVTGAATGTPGTTSTVQWNDEANSDPITDINVGQTTILQNTGYEANLLLFSYPVYQALRKHPLIIDRIKYTTPTFGGTITPQLLAMLFDVDEVLVSKAVYNSATEGATGSYSFVMGKTALLCHRASAPSMMEASAGYIFSWSGFTGLNNAGIRVQQMPIPLKGNGATRIEGEMSFDMTCVSPDLGYFYNTIVA